MFVRRSLDYQDNPRFQEGAAAGGSDVFAWIADRAKAPKALLEQLKPGGVMLFAESTRRYIHSWIIRLLFRDEGGANHALLRGEVDWYTSLTLGELLKARPELLEQYRRLLYVYDALGVYRVVWNCRRRPADDPRVRRALGMLFDVEGLRRGSEDLGPGAVAHA